MGVNEGDREGISVGVAVSVPVGSITDVSGGIGDGNEEVDAGVWVEGSGVKVTVGELKVGTEVFGIVDVAV